MSADDRLLALHGFRCRIPQRWEVALNRGDWRRGHLVLAERRRAALNLSWDRAVRHPDLERTITRIARRMGREHRATRAAEEALPGGTLVRFAAEDGVRHVAAWRPRADLPLVLVARQCDPGPADELRAVARSSDAVDDDQPAPWCIHGLDLVLPPRFRLAGMLDAVGMVRAVWFRHPDGNHKIDQLLVLRRFACAGRLLEGAGIGAWIARHLRRGERLEEERTAADGSWSGVVSVPGDGWWRRLRGVREERHLHAWIEPGPDRLVIQEWKGRGGEPLPPLPRATASEDAPAIRRRSA